ncbi:hypothetical protein BS628_06515 [Agrobacterium radiobacter]|nr:hypothetical protein BS628_06515 [Agrobacterium radiobacter]
MCQSNRHGAAPLLIPLASLPPSSLCLSQGSSRRASARREEFFQSKDLGWLDSCDKHRNEDGENVISVSGQTTHIWA